jgi:hypothetical protein
MKRLIITSFISIISISLVFLTSCSSSGEKAANEAIECMEKSIESNSDYENVLREFDECQKRIKEHYADKANDPKFAEDFEKEFAIKYIKLEEKMKKKFNNLK